MYDNATARVKLSSYEASKSFKCSKGVRQGCNLSPLLLNLFLKGPEVKLADNQAGVPLGETTIYTTSGKNHFHEMNGDVGMAGWK